MAHKLNNFFIALKFKLRHDRLNHASAAAVLQNMNECGKKKKQKTKVLLKIFLNNLLSLK